MTKVFVSHKKEDSVIAGYVARRLQINSIDVYLDVADPIEVTDGPDLGDYIRKKMAECTHLIAVISPETVNSWWVPWEIGVATEKNFPIASYLSNIGAQIPTYLAKWPLLKKIEDVDIYAEMSKDLAKEYPYRVSTAGLESAASAQNYSIRARNGVANFHRSLKTRLGQ